MAIVALGKVEPHVPGTPLRATNNRSDPTKYLGVQSITFQALPDNAGIVYIGLKGMVRATGVNVVRLVPKPVNALTGPFTTETITMPVAPAGFNAADIYVDVDTADDGVIVSAVAG